MPFDRESFFIDKKRRPTDISVGRRIKRYGVVVGLQTIFAIGSDDSHFGFIDKAEYVVYLRGGLANVFDTQNGIFKAGTRRVDLTIGQGNILYGGFVETVASHDKGVNAFVGNGVVCGNDIWRNIFAGAATALDERPTAYATVFLDDDTAGQNGFAVYVTVSREVAVDTENTVVVNKTIVSDAGAFENVIVVPYAGLSLGRGGTVDNDIFAYDVIVADGESGGVALESEVLRFGTENGTLKYAVVFAQGRSCQDAGIR